MRLQSNYNVLAKTFSGQVISTRGLIFENNVERKFIKWRAEGERAVRLVVVVYG